MVRRFPSVDHRQVMTSIERLCDRIRVFNAQLPNLIRPVATKSSYLAIGQLNVHVASLNVQLVQLKHEITRLEHAAVDVCISSGLQRRSPSTTSEELCSRNEVSFEENDVPNFNVTLSDSPVECAVITSAENVNLSEPSENSRRAKRRSRSLSIVKKMIRRLNRSITPSRRLLAVDNVDADVTLCEHI